MEKFIWYQSQPRIVQHQGKRYALRLETVFWQQLEKLALRRRVRLGRLIAELDAANDGPNLSSYIRGFCMIEAEHDITRFRLGAGAFDLLDVMAGCPAPALLLNQQKQIVDVNQSLLDWSEPRDRTSLKPILQQQDFEALFRPRNARPLEEVIALLRSGQLKRMQVQLSYIAAAGEAPRIVNATLTALPVGSIFYMLVWLAPVAPFRVVI